MSHFKPARAAALFAALALSTFVRAQDPIPLPLPPPPPRPASKSDGADNRVVLVERGPIHEGFAEPGAQVRGKGITAPKAPPAPVNEVPPLPRPEGANVRWVPGYWQWDADRTDFVWVCGLYRNAPPERAWEPGRWKDVKQQWTYFPGYWRPADNKPLPTNLPEPPAPKEEAPTAPTGNPNAMWVPGVWLHKGGKFEWQPGYWPAGSGTMIWQQGQYVQTETGFAFVPGHWDYPLEERGELYSPVYFSPAQRAKRGWAYRPEYVLSFGSESKWGQGGVFDSLAIGPNYNSYRFGNSSTNAALVPGAGSDTDRSWDAVAPGYTNPLWQHYLRLNRVDSGLARGAAPTDANRPTGGKNPLAFVTPGCHSSGCGVAPHVHWVATPIVHGGYRR
ncbi:MAG: hypothetical protein J0I06_17300 [Planctomycetes bacterium]|nr:hypothetical protein [Planctomycetota bacterium]